MSKTRIEGLKDVERALKVLPRNLQGNILRTANRRLIAPVRKDVKSQIPKRTGRASKELKIKTSRRDKTAVQLGFTSDAYYMRFLEKGTRVRQTRDGANRGSVTARPFIERTYNRGAKTIIKEKAPKEYGNIVADILSKKSARIRKKL